jgi:hypothetical protein
MAVVRRWQAALGLLMISASTGVVASRAVGANILERAEQVKDTYDYVIVGGGTAGLTVADRLTADGKCKSIVLCRATERSSLMLLDTVLVIENGLLGKLAPKSGLLNARSAH